MAKQSFLILSLVLFVAFFPTACKKAAPPFECPDPIGCVTIDPGKPLKLGVIQDLSGGASTFGTDQLRSIELAISKRDNQILGHPIVLQIEDEGCTAEGGRVAARKLVTDPQVVAILGTTCSGAAVAGGKIIAEAGLVMISGINSAPSLTSVGGKRGADWQPGYFRTMHNIIERGRVAAVFAFRKLGVNKAATINDGDAFTRGYSDVFGQTFTELGGEVVLETTVNKGDTNMRPVLTAVANSGAELVFFPLFEPEGIAIVSQIKEVADLEHVILMGSGVLLTNTFMESVGVDSKGMYFVVSAPPPGSAANDKLAVEYEARYGEPPQTVEDYGCGYDATNLLLKAIETVAVQEKDGTLHIGRQALRDALYATDGFEGVTGRLTCNEFGDCGVPRFNIVRLDDHAAGLEGLKANIIYTYTPEQ